MPSVNLGNVRGPQGVQGETGPQGPQGVQGQPGTDGVSAYEAAVAGGFPGTEEEFNAALATAGYGTQKVSITLPANWAGNGPYTQEIVLDSARQTAKVDLQADAETLSTLETAGVTSLYMQNNDGVITAVCVGGPPTAPVTVQGTIVDVAQTTAGVIVGDGIDVTLSMSTILSDETKEKYRIGYKRLGDLPVGTELTFPINYVPGYKFIIVHQGNPDSTLYDESCDGVWLLNASGYGNVSFGTRSTGNDFANGDMQRELENIYYANQIPSYMKELAKLVKIPYRPGSGSDSTVASGADGLAVHAFPLSIREVGGAYDAVDGVELDYFINGANGAERRNFSSTAYWTRSPILSPSADSAYSIDKNGGILTSSSSSANKVTTSHYVYPVMIFPADTYLYDDGKLYGEPPELPYETPDEVFSALSTALHADSDGFLRDINEIRAPISNVLIGSYVGTGEYGDARKANKLILPATPKFAMIVGYYGGGHTYLIFDFGRLSTGLTAYGFMTFSVSDTSGAYDSVSSCLTAVNNISGSNLVAKSYGISYNTDGSVTLSWYANGSALGQGNMVNRVYTYMIVL